MLHIEQISKQFPTKTLFNKASAHLKPNTRVGLVGPNGTGKTTILRMITGEDEPESGRIRKRPHLKIGYLPQELETLPGRTILEATQSCEVSWFFPYRSAPPIPHGYLVLNGPRPC